LEVEDQINCCSHPTEIIPPFTAAGITTFNRIARNDSSIGEVVEFIFADGQSLFAHKLVLLWRGFSPKVLESSQITVDRDIGFEPLYILIEYLYKDFIYKKWVEQRLVQKLIELKQDPSTAFSDENQQSFLRDLHQVIDKFLLPSFAFSEWKRISAVWNDKNTRLNQFGLQGKQVYDAISAKEENAFRNLCDITLECEGKLFLVHKLVLFFILIFC
jgi:hypothetical protein